MARYQMILAYDGTLYEGFQRQVRRCSVQSEVEDALKKIGWTGSSILSAGRTDSGVHASGQVIAFDLDWKHQAQDLVNAINANLPANIAAQAAREAPVDFHPRYDAISRIYRYLIFCEPQRNPLRERYAWRIWPELDISNLQSAARCIPGDKDFAAFGTPPRTGGSTIRNVTRAEWKQSDDEFQFIIEANAFLYHMVRRLVFLQVLVGSGKLSLERFGQGFSDGFIKYPGLAEASGLTLEKVCYSEQEIGSNGK